MPVHFQNHNNWEREENHLFLKALSAPRFTPSPVRYSATRKGLGTTYSARVNTGEEMVFILIYCILFVGR